MSFKTSAPNLSQLLIPLRNTQRTGTVSLCLPFPQLLIYHMNPLVDLVNSHQFSGRVILQQCPIYGRITGPTRVPLGYQTLTIYWFPQHIPLSLRRLVPQIKRHCFFTQQYTFYWWCFGPLYFLVAPVNLMSLGTSKFCFGGPVIFSVGSSMERVLLLSSS